MALNTSKCNRLTPLRFKGLNFENVPVKGYRACLQTPPNPHSDNPTFACLQLW